eukprot:403345817
MQTIGCNQGCAHTAKYFQKTRNYVGFFMDNDELISIGETLSADLFPEANFTTNNYSNYWNISSLAFISRTDIYGNILYLKSFDKVKFFDFYKTTIGTTATISKDLNYISLVQINLEEAYIIQNINQYDSIARLNLTQSPIKYKLTSIEFEDQGFSTRIVHLIDKSLYLFYSFNDGISQTISGVLRFNTQENKIRTSYTINGTFPGYFEYADQQDHPTEINTRYHAIIARNHNDTNSEIYVTLLKEINTDQLKSTFSTVKSYSITGPLSAVSSWSSGVYIDQAANSVAVGILEGSQLSVIGVLDFNQSGTLQKTFQLFYGAQLGMQITFTYFRFTSLTTGLLSGYILTSTNPAFPIIQDVGVLITIPKPYYFSMGTPDTRAVQVLDETKYIKNSNNHLIAYPVLYSPQITVYNSTEPYYFTAAVTSKMAQPISLIERHLLLPTTVPTQITQYLGDNVKVIPFDNCSYDQSICEDIEYTHYIQTLDGTKSKMGSPMRLHFKLNTNMMGEVYLVSIRPHQILLQILQLIVQTVNNNSSSNFNLAPMFYTKIQGFTVRAGSKAVLYLPDFFDPNGDDVTISAKQNGAYKGEFFKFLDNNRMEFNAGLKQLGDQDITVILTDNNINPLSTKYRIIVTVLQSDLIQMNNTDVVKSNLSDIVSIQDTSKFKVQQITPTGLVTIKFEKSLNSTNQTELIQDIYESLRLQIDDQSILFNWTVVYAKDNVLQIKIDFSRSLRFDFLFSEQLIQSTFDIPDQDAYNDNFRDFGYDSKIAFQNMGFNTSKVICIFAPTLLPFILTKNEKISFKQLDQIKPLHENLNKDKKWSTAYYSLYFIRRFIFVLSMLFFTDSPYLQLLTFQLLSIGQFIYLISVKPFETKTNNVMEFINEGLVLFTAEILILFTDYEPNPEHRYNLGWVVLSAIIFVSLVNMSLFFYQAIQTIKKIARLVGIKLKSLIYKFRTMRKSSSSSSTIQLTSTNQSLMKLSETKFNNMTKSNKESSIKTIFSKNSQQNLEKLRQSKKTRNYIDNSKTVRIDPINEFKSGQNVSKNIDVQSITDDEDSKQ